MSHPGAILVTGAAGQIGTELTTSLREKYDPETVIATDIKAPSTELKTSGPFESFDVLEKNRLDDLINRYNITQIYHLAAILSATGEQKPKMAWEINMKGLLNILEAAREQNINRVFWPSSIAVFGPTTPKQSTPQDTIMDPDTVYGISKLAGERWCYYYHEKFDVDIRSVRYPGLISYKTEPGGGTTDYAVEIFYKALEAGAYECFLGADTKLPMMYMPDAIKATINLMHADTNALTVRSSYNIDSFSFSPKELAEAIKTHLPDFSISYAPDYREQIAQSWPQTIDDKVARKDWNWQPDYDLPDMVASMLKHIKEKVGADIK